MSMTEEQARAAFNVERAERHLDEMKAARTKKMAELRGAEIALDCAYVELDAARLAANDIKSGSQT